MPLGRAFVALTLLLLLGRGWARRQSPLRMPLSAWLGLGYFLVAMGLTICGVNPGHGVSRLTKLLWYVALPVAATVAVDARFRISAIRAFVWGASLTGLRVSLWNPLTAWHAVAAQASATGFTRELIDTGSLTHAQLLMIGFLAAVYLATDPSAAAAPDDPPAGSGGFPPGEHSGAARPACSWRQTLAGSLPVCRSPETLCLRLLPVCLTGAGLVLALKRGPWFCALLMTVILLAPRLGWRRTLAGLVVAAGVAAAIPAVRARIADLPQELSRNRGGRIVMWTDVAVGLRQDYPRGIGFRSLTNDLMRRYAPGVEHDRNHLHSNIVETLVATGPIGLAIYAVWMLTGLRDARRLEKREQRLRLRPASGRILWIMLVALLLNGLVEYNFADAGIVLAYGLLMGLAAAGKSVSC